MNKCPTFSETNKKSCLWGKEAVKPQIHEVNTMNAPVLTVTNITQATTSVCLMKINCILFIEYRWPERSLSKQCRNNVATLCNSADCEDGCLFFSDRVIFFDISLPWNLWNSDNFYSNSSQSFPNWAAHATAFSPHNRLLAFPECLCCYSILSLV